MMKRKIISFVLVLTMVMACMVSMALPASAEESELPTVAFMGHQRTLTATDVYGIRLIGAVTELSPKAVGFDIAFILADGTMATYSDEVSAVYRSVKGMVNGEEREFSAGDIDENYEDAWLYTIKVNNIPADQGFIGILCSVYMIDADGNKQSGETYRIVYNGSEQWHDTYGLVKTTATYQGYGVGTAMSDQYQFVQANNATNDSEMKNLWDGVVDTTYGGLYTWGWENKVEDSEFVKGSYNMARFEKPTVIGRITLVSVWHQDYNKGTQIQASVDGEEWVTLYTITSDKDSAFLTHGWGQKYLTFDVEDETAYNYIRVYDNERFGFSFSEVTVYEVAVVAPLEKVSATYTEHGAAEGAHGFYGTDRAASEVTYMWDGKVDSSYTYCMTWGAGNGTAYNTASFAEATVIGRVVLYVNDRHDKNVGTQIQASVDGENWDTLYTISSADGDFVKLAAGTMKILTVEVTGTTAYRYIRVKDSVSGGYAFAEIEIYSPVELYGSEFAEKLNTTLPVT